MYVCMFNLFHASLLSPGGVRKRDPGNDIDAVQVILVSVSGSRSQCQTARDYDLLVFL